MFIYILIQFLVIFFHGNTYSRKQRKMVRYYFFGLQSSIVLTFLIAAVFKTSSCAITLTYKAKFCKIKMQVLLRTQKKKYPSRLQVSGFRKLCCSIELCTVDILKGGLHT